MREEQLVRHWHILKTLERRRQGVLVNELAEELECSERTIFRDLAALQEAGFPLSTEKKDGLTCYRFIDGYKPGASLEVSNDELLALYLSSGLLKMMQGTVFQKSLARLIKKVLEKIPEQNLAYFQNLSKSIAVGRGASRDYGAKHKIIKEIMKALSGKKVLRIRYCSGSSNEAKDRRVDPYKLWYANDAFYLIGWCHVHDMVRTFLVDRIEEAAMTGQGFTPSRGFDFSKYHDDAFRVIRDGRKRKVIILFDKEVAHCFREKKWHPSQQADYQQDGSVKITIEAEGLDEIRSWVLSWGGRAEVIEPASLRREIRDTCAELLEKYGRGTAGKGKRRPQKKHRGRA